MPRSFPFVLTLCLLICPVAPAASDPPTVTLLTPAAGDILEMGSRHVITWTSADDSGTVAVRLEWSPNSGASFGLIDSVDTDTAAYDWFVPNVATTAALVRVIVYDADGNAAADATDGVFAIIAPPPSDSISPTVHVLEPNGGDSLLANTIHRIRWTAADNQIIASLRIDYSGDNGATYTKVDSLSFDVGTYIWATPATDSDSARIRVMVWDNVGNEASDESDAPFTVWTPPQIRGDVNMDYVVNSSDIIYLVNFVFKGGPAPRGGVAVADNNCDTNISNADIILMINFVFKAGPELCPF